MKFFLVFFNLILFSFSSFTQQQFQGKVVYVLTLSDDEADKELTLLFGKNQFKLSFAERKASGSRGDDAFEILIDLDSAKIYTLFPKIKEYTVKELIVLEQGELLSKKIFSGHKASPVDITSKTYLGVLSTLFKNARTVLYIADSLYYPIPEKFRTNPELIFIYEDHILLGAEVKAKVNDFSGKKPGEKDMEEVTVVAKEIITQTFPESTFKIPQDFSLQNNDWKIDSLDSVAKENMEIIDSTVEMHMDAIEKESQKKSIEKPVPKKAPVKKPASKPKSKTPLKSPIKKQD